MLNFVCVKHGPAYGADYVNRLYAMIARNLALGTEGRFVCYTDDATDIRPEIHVRKLPANVTGWWAKLFLFSAGEFADDDRIVFFDLDTLIVGDIDELCRYTGRFAILRDFYRADGLQSAVMLWEPSNLTEALWNDWLLDGCPKLEGGDQEWIERRFRVKEFAPDILQDLFPRQLVSFKVDCIPYPPDDARVVCFHGEPKPANCGRSWVEALWSESDTGHFQLAMIANVSLEQIKEQTRLSALRGLKRLVSMPPNQDSVVIVGGGPSLEKMTKQLQARYASGEKIWALNGSFRWLRAHGINPHAMVLLDAREDNVRFIEVTDPGTRYYVASQCHPAVFDRLAGKAHDVVRIDLAVMGDCGTTVGTHAICVAFTEGYRDIHLYGFDSSYEAEKGHAYEQPMNGGERIVDAHCGNLVFKAAPWMVRQVQDFQELAPVLIEAGAGITVHGTGLLPYAAFLMANPHLCQGDTAAERRAAELLGRLDGQPAVIGAEIGVFAGEMSMALLRRPGLSLFMVDSWEAGGAAYAGDSGDWHAKLSQEKQDRYADQAKAVTEFASARRTILRMRSLAASCAIPDAALDFVFIDADHSYEGCKADIAAWWGKVKEGGLVAGHDYGNVDFPGFGVTRAVDELAAALGQTVELGDNFTWFLRRKGELP